MNINTIYPQDYHELEQLGKTCLPIYFNYQDLIYCDMFQNNTIMLKASINSLSKQETKIIGLMFCVEEKDLIHINSFCVDESHRKKGCGAKLINKIKQYGKKITLNVLETNTTAIRFYEKHGFKLVEVKKNYYRELNNSKNDAYFYCFIPSVQK